MAFQQYTRCIAANDWPSNRIAVILGYGAVAGATATGIIAVAGRWDCWPLILQITAFAMVVGYCENWLYQRLICLGGDVDCIGVIVSVSPPSPDLVFSSTSDVFDLDWDTDYSINLLLQNTPFGTEQADAELIAPYGHLIAPHPDVIAIGRETKGLTAEDKQGTKLTSAILHAEFEGAGNYNLMQAADAALWVSIAALFACILLPFPASLIVAALAWLILILGAILANDDVGSPSDVDAPELHTNDEPNGDLGAGADVYFVQGTWVYDTLHEGWNEIHPIKVAMKMGCWKGDWNDISCDPEDPPTPPDVILRVRHGFKVAKLPETLANQALPEHQWQVHPALDSCSRGIIL